MSRFLWWAGFSPVSVFSPANPAVVLPFWPCLVCLCRIQCLQLRLHGVHGHSHMCQLFHYCWVRSVQDFIVLCQSFQIVALCLHALHNFLNVLYCLMILFWRGMWCNIYIFHRHSVTSFTCVCYRSSLLSMRYVEEQLVFGPRILIRGLTSPLADVVIENPRLRQKGNPFGHHHVIIDGLSSFSRKLYPLFLLFNQSGKCFCGVVGPHHLHRVLFEVDFADFPVTG